MKEKMNERKVARERLLKINLSDQEIEDISMMAGKVNLTVSELLENFVADLVGSDRRNGSDECDCADAWFERCWFSNYPEDTFLRYVLMELWSAKEIISDWNVLKSFEEDLKCATDSAEIAEIQDDIDRLKEDIRKVYDGYVKWCKTEPDGLECCMEQLVSWKQRMDELKDDTMKQDVMNPLVNITAELCFEISGSEVYGGAGSVGYSSISLGGIKNISLISNEYVVGQTHAMADFFQVPVEAVRLISKEEYEQKTEEDNQEI